MTFFSGHRSISSFSLSEVDSVVFRQNLITQNSFWVSFPEAVFPHPPLFPLYCPTGTIICMGKFFSSSSEIAFLKFFPLQENPERNKICFVRILNKVCLLLLALMQYSATNAFSVVPPPSLKTEVDVLEELMRRNHV